MKESLITHFISDERFSNYINIEEYTNNLQVSKKSYIPLAVIEVSLRNAIDQHLTHKIGSKWYIDKTFLTTDSFEKVQQAISTLRRRREKTIKNKVIAELTLGFWVNLFKRPYDKKLRINDLKKIFPNLPSRNERMINREVLYKELDHIRNFRNRVFHYEKVVNKDRYGKVFEEMNQIMRYFDSDIQSFAEKVNQ